MEIKTHLLPPKNVHTAAPSAPTTAHTQEKPRFNSPLRDRSPDTDWWNGSDDAVANGPLPDVTRPRFSNSFYVEPLNILTHQLHVYHEHSNYVYIYSYAINNAHIILENGLDCYVPVQLSYTYGVGQIHTTSLNDLSCHYATHTTVANPLRGFWVPKTYDNPSFATYAQML